jgi:hypothetical protein
LKRTMAKKNKYSVKSSDFHDYFEGKLSNRERNAFERKMQKDLFNADAAEGFALVSREEAEEDLDIAGKKIRRRINLRRRVGWYSAAATLAAILTITTIFLTVDQTPNDQDERISKMNKELDNNAFEEPKIKASDENQGAAGEENIAGEVLLMEDREETVSESLSEAVVQPAQIGEGAAPSGVIDDNMKDDMAFEVAADQGEVLEFAMDMAEEAVISDAAAPAYIEADEIASRKMEEVTVREVVPLSVNNTDKSSRAVAAKRKATESEELKQVTGSVVAQDLSQTNSIQKAVPINGMTAYMEYVDTELVFPADEYSRNAAVVDIKFTVLLNGRLDNIQIISSPSKAFSDEVQRVITSGSAWTPAVSDGEIIESEIEMQIEFVEKHKHQ